MTRILHVNTKGRLDVHLLLFLAVHVNFRIIIFPCKKQSVLFLITSTQLLVCVCRVSHISVSLLAWLLEILSCNSQIITTLFFKSY